MVANQDTEKPIHILLVEDEPDLRSALRYNLKRAGYQVSDVVNGREAAELADKIAASTRGNSDGNDDRYDAPGSIDIVVSDIMMPEMDGIALAKHLRANPAYAETPLLFLTAKGEAADRLEGFRVGADDYLTKPFDLEELLARVKVQARRATIARKVRGLIEQAGPEPGTQKPEGDLFAKVAKWEERFPALTAIRERKIVGQSPRMIELLREVLIRAPGRDPVLIVGETGTGKTGVAEALANLGPRADKAFRVVNCAELGAADSAITLGKLFGYGKGSGLSNVPKDGQPGLLEDVDGGTLFLDEIHRLPREAQAMLLLPIEGRPFHPALGKGDPQTVDVKFIFATNVDLADEAKHDRFPFDLYQRLAASQIRMPSLAERRQDIPALAERFVDECRDEFDLPDAVFAPSLLKHLEGRSWPGNVRELRSLVREIARRAAFEIENVLTLSHLPDHSALDLGAKREEVAATPVAPDDDVPGQFDDSEGFWNEVEVRELGALRRHRFKIAPAEQELGLSSKSRTLTNHLRGMCFKAMVHRDFSLPQAARLVVGRDDEALLDRTIDRMDGYLDMVARHAASHTTKTLFNNLPRDYRKFVERGIDHARDELGL